jgi:hypothetical protein
VTLALGANPITTVASDKAGNTTTDTRIITLDTTPPVVWAGTNQVTNGTITITGSATDTLDSPGLTYQWSQVPVSTGLGTVTFSAPNSLTTQVTASQNGVYTLQLTATDSAGNTATSTMNLTWDTVNPTVSAGSNQISGIQFTQTGSVADALPVTTLQWSQVSGPGTITFGTPTALTTTVSASQAGVYVISLTATDAAGNSSSSVATITWDVTPPVLSLSTLPNGSYTATNTLPINGVATDTQAGMQQVTINGAVVAQDPSSGAFSTSVTLNLGPNVISTIATDQAGNQSSDTRTIIYDPTVPTITIGAPASVDYATNQSTVTIAGIVSSQCTVSMTVSNASSPPQIIQTIASVPVSLSGNSYSFTQAITGLPTGLSTITITAITPAGVASSTSVSVTYDNTSPVLTVDSPATDIRPATNSLTVSGTASDAMTDVTVTIQVGSNTYTPEVVNGTYSQMVQLSAQGYYPLTVQATNAAGSQTTVTRRIIYATPTGDVNGDGVVDISDALLALQVSVGLKPLLNSYLVYGDVGPLVNNVPAPDWKINISDVVVILRIIVGSVTLSQ